MPQLSNPRHEAYAINRAAGLKQLDAYVNAGFEASASAASQLEARPEVKARIQEVIGENQERRKQADEALSKEPISDMGRDWVLRELRQNVKSAQTAGQISAANKAIEMIMDIVGLGTPPKKSGKAEEEDQPASTGPVSDAKMAAALDKLEMLGKTREGGAE